LDKIKDHFSNRILMARIELLTPQEIKKFEMVPAFINDIERNYYLTLPNGIYQQALTLGDDRSFVIFTLLFGYFKATHTFFEPSQFYQEDVMFIVEKYQLSSVELDDTVQHSRTLQRYKRFIKSYLNINEFSQEIKGKLQDHAIELANNFTHRKKIFFSLVDLSKKLNIEIPSYSSLSKIIGYALRFQTQSILTKLKAYKEDSRLELLNDFIDKDDNYKNRYNIGSYKKLGHSTNKKQMGQSLVRLESIQSKFKMLQPIINDIGITSKVAEYHSKWIQQSRVIQLTRKDIIEQHFLLLSFVKYQYFIRNDNLIDRFIITVQSAKNALLRHQKDLYYANEPVKQALIQSLEDSNLSVINDMSSIVDDSSLSDSSKVKAMKRLLDTKTKNLQNLLGQKREIEERNLSRFDFVQKASKSLQGKLSGIVKTIEFDEESSNKHLIMAIKHFRDHSTISKNTPMEFLDEEEKQAVLDGETFNVSLYKALLFIHISDGIKSGILNLHYSYKYKSFENYLIPKEAYQKNKQELLQHYELEHLEDFNTFIAPISNALEKSFETTNSRITKSLNIYFRLTPDSFILTTPKIEKTEEQQEPTLAKYLPQVDFISVIDLLHSIQSQTKFLNAFKHYSLQHVQTKKLDPNLLYASIVGYGCNISLSKMAKISKGIGENELDTATTWYLSEENTNEANDKILSFIDTLAITKYLKSNPDINHTSSDGQKYTVKSSIDSTNAGHSHKYFGLDKGVVTYTFIDETHKLFYSIVINVNERESGYVIDGLMHNDVVKSHIHSTDTHGFSEVIFGLTHLLGFAFAPRIKNFKHQQLYGIHPPKQYQAKGYPLLPKRKVNMTIIKEHWDDILRFVLTIKSRKTTASQLLKRLTSYSKHHKLYTAIKEFGKIIKTDFLLTYIDDVELRQQIEKQLNKVEASNKFSKAVFFGNNAEFTFASQEEQNIANNCKRLIQNAVILWNYLYINKKLQDAKSQTQKDEIIQAVKNSSMVHWGHINFYGTYDFTKVDRKVNAMIS
jgi:TnpA family transposase